MEREKRSLKASVIHKAARKGHSCIFCLKGGVGGGGKQAR